MLGKKIAEIRKRKGYTLSRLAKLTNISKSYLSNMERNLNNNPSLEILKKIAVVLEVELLTLVETGSEEQMYNQLEKEWTDFIEELKVLGVEKGNLSEYKTLIEFIKWQNSKPK